MKALRDLTVKDLERCPIWHYQGLTDEEATVSPATGFNNPNRNIYIAYTRFVLTDGSEWWGYCSPTDDSGLDYVQPVILTPDGPVIFWYDDWPEESEPDRACHRLGKSLTQVFPVQFECMVPFENRIVTGRLLQIEILPAQMV